MLAIIHLSDIHFSQKYDNSLFDKKAAFFKSFIAQARAADNVIVCVSGDTANFGNEYEYNSLAFPFFMELKAEVEKEIPKGKIDFLFIPGNHDCDFSDEDAMLVRDDLIDVLTQNPDRVSNSSYVRNVITQDYYLEFRDLFHRDWDYCSLVETNDLIQKVKVEVDGKTVMFSLYNSSWISTRNEKPGQMLFPSSYIKEGNKIIGDVNISVIHHPTHWLEPNNKREIEVLLRDSSDIILSGHEHVPTVSTLSTSQRRQLHYIEGNALQELSDPSISGYNVIILDLEQEAFQVKRIYWDHTYYREDELEEKWTSFIQGLSVKANDPSSLIVNSPFDEVLRDVGIPITHPRIKNLGLENIYVFPHVEEVIYKEESEVLMSPEDLPTLLEIENEAHLLFTGDKDSGKTALAKMIFLYYQRENFYPLYIDGTAITPSTSRNINLLIKKNVSRVYEEGKEDLYLQLSSQERILIIDDWHKTLLNSTSKSRFLSEVSQYFKQVVFLAEINDSLSNTIDLHAKEGEYRFRHFKLMEFGYGKRDEFIEKWVSLGQEDTLEDYELIRETERIKRILRPVLMQSFVPKYPLYLLIILNTIESGTPHNLDKSSNGYYFEILIKDSLASIQIENNETDKIYQYLTDLAFELFQTPSNSIDLGQWRDFHRKHLDYYDMNDDQIVFKDIKDKLEKEKVIRNKQSSYEFYYPYVYYFFTAQYFARNINRTEVKGYISTLCNNLHIVENANIIMFLTHLSKDEFIKDEVLKAAQGIFGETAPLQLDGDVSIINELCDEISPFVLQDINVREHRKKMNEQLDEMEREDKKSNHFNTMIEQLSATESTEEEAAEVARVMQQINMTNKGFKMLDIIGQILRNYYGSMSGIDKMKMCEEHYQLGLRISHNYITELSNNNENLIHYISSFIVEKGYENPERAEKVAKRVLYSVGGFIVYNILGKIGISIGTPDLDRTFTRVQEHFPYNSVELINIFIKIEYYEQFPYQELRSFYERNKNNNLAKQILQNMVKRYLYMFDTSRSDKQKICDAVGITIDPKMRIQLQKASSR
ncbi:metallophosphoesterase [Neobacillus sp. YIM B06451]|uniref:metallophosphoesterase n=1 Tax=Neobacillus sp. YIM B06451 TaxID=3070994 RepID=UPI00292F148C|nr:metallophosphoesterase [Neobacillus sp. YIM B06451]